MTHAQNPPKNIHVPATCIDNVLVPRALLEQALKAIHTGSNQDMVDAEDALRAALDAPEVEPVAAILEVRRVDGPWQRYDLYPTVAMTERMKATVEGDGVEAQVIPLYTAPQPAQPAPDCRTCEHCVSTLFAGQLCSLEDGARSACTNGDQYQPAPSVVLWRTE